MAIFRFLQNGRCPPSWIRANVDLNHSRKAFSGLYQWPKLGWNRCNIFDNIQALIFCKLGFKMEVFVDLTPSWDWEPVPARPQKALSCAETKSSKSVYRCGLGAIPRIKSINRKHVTSHVFAQTTQLVKIRTPDGFVCVIMRSSYLCFQVSSKSVHGFRSHKWVEIRHFHYFGYWLLQQLVHYSTSSDLVTLFTWIGLLWFPPACGKASKFDLLNSSL